MIPRPLVSALALIALVTITACQPTSPLQNATASTPVRALPMSVAFQAQTLPTAVPPEIISAADAEYLLLENVYARLTPSVVNIDVTIRDFNPESLQLDAASGSGFVYDAQGHIITNAHVVNDADEIFVTFNDGFVAEAQMIGFDLYSDLAVIRIDAPADRLIPVTFADSNAVRVGQRAIAIGNPFGLASSMTVGVVSALGRQLPSAEMLDINMAGFQNPSIIQVDTDINPGNSGGPLLNSAGEVIGVNTAIRTETGTFQGVGFAVPSATVQRVIPDLIRQQRVDYAWLGISSLPVEGGFSVAGLAGDLNLPVDSGVLVDTVTPDSPASKAGLRGGNTVRSIRGRDICAGGDIIVAVNGTYINTMDELVYYLVVNTRPGDEITLLVVRGEETFDVPVMLEGRPAEGRVPLACGS
ncbi:MAG: trypsin-like peptidase domain-containing protein [bacterium]|nr:trypsin-like peptidase domain-containing protein [bacterium]